MSTSRMSAIGSASLLRARRTLAPTLLPLPLRATPAARMMASAAAPALDLAGGAARAARRQRSANNGQGWAFPEGATAVAAAAVAAAGALVASSSPSSREEGDTMVLAAGAYSIPIGRSSPDVVSVSATAKVGWFYVLRVCV